MNNLDDVVSPVRLWDPAFRPYKNKYKSEFTLFAVPSDVGSQNECSGGPITHAAKKTKQKYGQYFGSALHLHQGSLNEGTLYLVWTKQYKNWQIVNVEYMERADPGLSASADVELPEDRVELRQVAGDVQANQSIRDFLTAWLLQGDVNTAASFVSPAAYSCFDQPLSAVKGKQSLLSGLSEVRKTLGQRAVLADYMEPFVPEDPTFHLVSHRDEKAFAILSPPDSTGEGLLYTARKKPDDTADTLPTDRAYGRYYIGSFEMKVPEGEPASLYTIWTREADTWKMVGWRLIAP